MRLEFVAHIFSFIVLVTGCIGPTLPPPGPAASATSAPSATPTDARLVVPAPSTLTPSPTQTTTPTAEPTSTSTPPPLVIENLTTPTGTVQPKQVALRGRLLVDSEAGRLYAAGEVDGKPKTLVLAASDGHLLATYDVAGKLGLDAVHGWLYVDRPDQGVAVLDAQTGDLQAVISLPEGDLVHNPAPEADPVAGHVLAFREHIVYVADPRTGEIIRTIPSNVLGSPRDCNPDDGPQPIAGAIYDPTHQLLYLGFQTYICTPWYVYTLVSYDMPAGTEIARQHLDHFSATAHDGYLYASSWNRMGIGYYWTWQNGQLKVETLDWRTGDSKPFIDPARQRWYEGTAKSLRVLDPQTMALRMYLSLPIEGWLAGYDPGTDQLYFLSDGRLQRWPASELQPPAPQPLTASEPPTSAVRSLIVSPTWDQDRTLFGIWDEEFGRNTCYAFGQTGGWLYLSSDGGDTWAQPHNGLPQDCEGNISTLAVSPAYATDHTLLTGVLGLGVFRSTDGGQSWQPSGAGLSSMGVRQILLSPGFHRDGMAFARLQTGKLHRSTDGGDTWEALEFDLYPIAMSPEFDEDHTLMGVAPTDTGERSRLLISRDGGDRWEWVGETPAGGSVTLLSLAPLFDKWHVVFALGGNGTLYRSSDGGISWVAVLSLPGAHSAQLAYAPDIEVNRPVFLLVRIRHDTSGPLSERVILYRSGDGGLTWQQVELPEDVSPTALAVSPNFAQDGLLFVGTADGQVLTFEDSTLTGQTR